VNVPDAVGVPLIVYTPLLKDPETPAGNPDTVAPVAPFPTIKLKGSIAVLIHLVWEAEPLVRLMVVLLITVIVPSEETF
jgi:hypothetical protein